MKTASELVTSYAALIKNKTILTTGVSPGSLGGYFVQSLAKAQPACLILAGRNDTKLEECKGEIQAISPETKVRMLKMDLNSLQSVRAAADQVNSWTDIPAIDVLVNNAGIMAVEYGLSVDGVEKQLATNHLAPFLFTNMIMDKILKSESPRVVNVSSDGHRLSPIRFADPNFEDGKTYNKWVAYGQSKTANMLLALSLASKLGVKHGLLAFSLHPGVIGTNLGNHLDWSVDLGLLQSTDKSLGNAEGWKELTFITPDQGVATHVFASFDPNLKANNGAYLIDARVADPLSDTVKSWATNSLEAERLWQLSEKLVGEEFKY
ncbi:hypothetical protein N7474_003060 [Penicillium riverlandense]|uniref:uncharacterized protein n=1 Tax=Penicillium riverlandense TaxID=1903569 RepID=UPI002547E0AA|nr:uncharacterized protein N7474_003060 [Penicillium riverlandense]KAJ5825922.1 hypothetical protein N7474_003060 [Penicillium riverlandense]